MGYLSFQIIFFLLLAAALGFVIGWLLRGNRFQTELQDLDNRWRTKLGEVESERDRFVGELTQTNEAKTKLEAELKRLSDTHESSLQQLKRDHQTKIAGLQKSNGDAGRLGGELAAANERAASLEKSFKDAQAANTNCKNEVDRLKAQIADLQRSGGTTTGSSSSGGAMGLMGSAGSGVSSGSAGGGTGAAGGATGSTGGGGVGGSSGGASGGTGTAGGAAASTGGGAGLRSIAGGGGQSGGSDPSYTQRAASPSYLADAGGQGFGSASDAQSGSGSPSGGSADDESEGVQPTALTEARGGKADDLKRISGVGPKLEKTLNGLGIFHFAQIADFTRDNVSWVDRHLRFKGRIDREKWIEQAKVLASGGDTEFSKRQ